MWITGWPAALLAAEVAIFYRKVLFAPGAYVIPWDFHYYHYNLASFLASSIREGRLPLWDPYTYCGQPFFANLTTQMFYPPALATAALAAVTGLDDLLWLETVALVAHVFFAGITTYWFLRKLDLANGSALIGATAFQLGCYFATQTQHVGAIMGASWLPFCALALFQRRAALLAVGIAGSILAGFPSATAAVAFAIVVLALPFKAIRTAAIGVLAGIALSAIQLLPTLQLSALSVAKYRGDFRAPGSGIRLEALPSLVWPNYFHILDLKGFSLPYNFTFLYLYCGLAILALVFLARHRLTIPFVILAVISALIMFGDSIYPGSYLNTLVLNITHDSVYPEFFMAAFSFGVATLAAFGAQRFASRPRIQALILLATIVELTAAGSSRPMNTAELVRDPGVTSHHFDGNVELLKGVQTLVKQFAPPARVDTYGDSMSWAMMASTTRIPTANGNEPFALESIMTVRRQFCGGERWGRYFEVSNLESPVLDQIGVRYLISRGPLPPNSKFSPVAQLPGHVVYENRNVLPRFLLDGAEVQLRQYAPETVELDVNTNHPGRLVTAETDYPGWRAYVDDKPVPILRSNVAFRSVDVPAGRHRVAFRFVPTILGWGALISFLTAVSLILARRRLPTQ